MTDTTPQAALLSDAAKLADEYRVTMPREVFAIWGAEAQAELRRLDALVAHLTADRDDTANELALRTKHNLTLTNERDQLLAKLQATQAEPAQAVELPDERASTNCDNILRKLDGLISNINEIHAARTDAERNELVREANVNRQFLVQMITRAALSARKPLTDEQIVASLKACEKEDHTKEGWIWRTRIKWARAIERAHGIGLEVKP